MFVQDKLHSIQNSFQIELEIFVQSSHHKLPKSLFNYLALLYARVYKVIKREANLKYTHEIVIAFSEYEIYSSPPIYV